MIECTLIRAIQAIRITVASVFFFFINCSPHFRPTVPIKKYVPCERNSYSFIPILLKLYRCLDHALNICTGFGHNTQSNFLTLFLVIFSDMLTKKVIGQWVRCVRNSSFIFIPSLLKLYRCLYHVK